MAQTKKMTKTAAKIKAQDLIMEQIAKIGYDSGYETFKEAVGDSDAAEAIMKEQMDRVAKMFGYKEAWFY